MVHGEPFGWFGLIGFEHCTRCRRFCRKQIAMVALLMQARMCRGPSRSPARRSPQLTHRSMGGTIELTVFHADPEPDDIQAMRSLQQEVREYLTRRRIEYLDNTTSFKALDFTLQREGRGPLRIGGQGETAVLSRRPLADIDSGTRPLHSGRSDRAQMPGLCAASGVLVRDNCRSRYGFFSVIDLALMPRERVNREIDRGTKALKGKWMIDLNNSALANSLDGVFDHIRRYLVEMDSALSESLPCLAHTWGRPSKPRGKTRRPRHWTVGCAGDALMAARMQGIKHKLDGRHDGGFPRILWH